MSGFLVVGLNSCHHLALEFDRADHLRLLDRCHNRTCSIAEMWSINSSDILRPMLHPAVPLIRFTKDNASFRDVYETWKYYFLMQAMRSSFC